VVLIPLRSRVAVTQPVAGELDQSPLIAASGGLSRRGFFVGLAAAFAAPAIVRATSLMPVRSFGTSRILTIEEMTREAVRLWKNSNAFLRNIDMQYVDACNEFYSIPLREWREFNA